MIKISQAIKEITDNNQLIEWGLSKNIINLSKLAEIIKPTLENRVKRQLSLNAIKMSLSRERKRKEKSLEIKKFRLQNISVNSNLLTLTYPKTNEIHGKINELYKKITKNNGYLSITEGMNQITIIFNESYQETIYKLIKTKPLNKQTNIAGVRIEFSKEYTNQAGLFFSVIEKITLQNLSIVEISSTYTELIIYFREKDIKIAFNTIMETYSEVY